MLVMENDAVLPKLSRAEQSNASGKAPLKLLMLTKHTLDGFFVTVNRREFPDLVSYCHLCQELLFCTIQIRKASFENTLKH